MTDSIIRAWALAADAEFGGSLDDPPKAIRRNIRLGAAPKSGVPYCYAVPGGWQVRIPDVKTRKFTDLAAARAFVALHVDLTEEGVTVQLERYCSCGGKLRIVVPQAKRDAALAIWFSVHAGEGHRPATREEAKRATSSVPPL